MATVKLNTALRAEYQAAWDSMEVTASRTELTRFNDHAVEHMSRYDAVSRAVDGSPPWWFIALIHWRESTGNFHTHLHNGDPLTGRTQQVPAGRPKAGEPPFTWEESAVDAIKYQRLDRVNLNTVPEVLYRLEAYNGFGYRQHHADETVSPYLWSGSDLYTRGKYTADGKFSATAVDKQLGVATAMRHGKMNGLLNVADHIPQHLIAEGPSGLRPGAMLRYGEAGPQAEELQRWLNTFPSVALGVDGDPGTKTSDAVMRVLGTYLSGDPRAGVSYSG